MSQEFSRKYFSALLETMEQRGIQMRSSRRPYSGTFQIIDSWPEKIDLAVKILTGKKQISVDLTLKGEGASEQFDVLREDQAFFDLIIGPNVNWNSEPPHERQIIVVLSADPTEEKDWPRQHAWAAAKLMAFRIAFEPAIQRITRR